MASKSNLDGTQHLMATCHCERGIASVSAVTKTICVGSCFNLLFSSENAFVDLQFQTGSYISNLKVPVHSFAQPQTIKADLPELNCIQNGNENARTIKPWIVPKVGKSVGKDGQVMG